MTCSNDIFTYFVEDPSDAQLLRVSRISTVVFGIAAAAIAIDPPGTIVVMYEWRAIFLTSALLVPVYAAMYVSDVPGVAILSSIVIGLLFGTVWESLDAPVGIPTALLATSIALLVLLVGRHVWRERDLEPPASKPA